jgi:hypothetical protein
LVFTPEIQLIRAGEELRSDPPVQNLNNRNNRSKPGQVNPVAKYFFKNSTTA